MSFLKGFGKVAEFGRGAGRFFGKAGEGAKNIGRVGEGAGEIARGAGRLGKGSKNLGKGVEGGGDLLKTKNLESEVQGLNTRLGKIGEEMKKGFKSLEDGMGESGKSGKSGFFSKWGKRGGAVGLIVGIFEYVTNPTDDPSTGDCHFFNWICHLESFWHKFKIILIIIGVILLILTVIWIKSFFPSKNSGNQQPQKFVAPGNSSENGDGDVLSVTQGGGGKKNLDKYMYCLILLLGIGIHYLYENYEQKITQYTELIDKEKDDQKR